MSARSILLALLGVSVCFIAGCRDAPGKPGADSAAVRPEQVLNFGVLYKQNCAACHGAEGRNGAAISLANPVYLRIAGVDNLKQITAMGIPGSLMPPFAAKEGGTLTDAQVSVLANGMVAAWGNTSSLAELAPMHYASRTTGNSERGKSAFTVFCARCHGPNGEGISNKSDALASIVDPAYLDLVSDQALRSLILAGRPDLGMPDWRFDGIGPNARPMTDQEIADIVAWLRSHSANDAQQPFANNLSRLENKHERSTPTPG